MDCTKITGPSGELYDLYAIIGKEVVTNDGFSEYKASVCKNAYSCGGCPEAGFCQTNEFFVDCLGKFAGASVQETGKVQIRYDQGDWGNYAMVVVYCNPLVDGIANVRGTEGHKVTTCESKYACPHNPGKLDPGYPFSILIPGYFSVQAPVQKGAAVAVARSNGLYTLNITVMCATGGCLFKGLLLDSSNMQNWLTDRPFVCINSFCDVLWEQFHFVENINANGSEIYVVVLPQKLEVLSIHVQTALAKSYVTPFDLTKTIEKWHNPQPIKVAGEEGEPTHG